MYRTLTFVLSFLFLFIVFFSTPAYAGGGQYHPLNFSWGQVIVGQSINIEMEVYKDDMSAHATGEEFEIIAHHDLPGASCETTQRIADNDGKIKGSCHASGYGTFVFDVQPVSRQNIQGSVTIDVIFSQQPTETGYTDQGSQSVNQTEAVILQSPASAELGKQFVIEVKAKKNGQIQDDTSLIQSVRWTVLRGSMVSLGSVEGAGNRKLNIFTDDRGTVLIADVTLNTGEQIKTPSKAISFISPASPTIRANPSTSASASPTTSPQASPQPSSSPKTASPKPSPSVKNTPLTATSEAETASASATAEAKIDPSSAPEVRVQPKHTWWRKIWSWFSHWRK